MTSDDPWPWYMTSTSLTYKGTHIASLTQVWFQSDFNFSKENQITKTNIFHLTWPQMTLDLSMWPLTSLTFEGAPIASLTQVKLWSDFNFSKETWIIIQILYFSPNLTSDDLDLINIQRNPYCIFKPSLVPIGLQLFKGDPYNENQHFPPNLTSDDLWPWYINLINLLQLWPKFGCSQI